MEVPLRYVYTFAAYKSFCSCIKSLFFLTFGKKVFRYFLSSAESRYLNVTPDNLRYFSGPAENTETVSLSIQTAHVIDDANLDQIGILIDRMSLEVISGLYQPYGNK